MRTKIILIIIALFAITKTYSQTYEPIVDTTKMWVVYEYGMDPFAGRTYAYKITSDSVFINTKYWHNVLISEDSSYSQWTSYYNAKIREENKIVYYFDDVFPNVDTMYNFNLSVGDTCFVNTSYWYLIENIFNDFFAGKNRYTQSIYGISDTIYSGIGSKQGGLFGAIILTGSGKELVCYYENDSLLYLNSDYNSCYIDNTTNNINILRTSVFEIYPNPAKDIVQITINKEQLNKNTSIFIYDVYGRVVRVITNPQGEVISSNNEIATATPRNDVITIDVSQLPKGIYFIKIGNITKKFVKM